MRALTGSFGRRNRYLVLVLEFRVNPTQSLERPPVEQNAVALTELAGRGVQNAFYDFGVTSAELHEQGINGFVFADGYADGIGAGFLTQIAVESHGYFHPTISAEIRVTLPFGPVSFILPPKVHITWSGTIKKFLR